MIEEKLTVGKLFTPTKPKWTDGVPAVGSFVAQTSNHLSLPRTERVKRLGRTSTVVQVMDNQPNRNFRWLTYYKGRITTMALGGMDILTGDMSGCWITVYADPAGQRRVAHVGTDHFDPAASLAVKATWNAFAQANPERVIAGFKPNAAWDGQAPPKLPNESGDRIWALVTAKLELYTFYLYELGGYAEHIYRVAGVKKITSSNTTALSNLP